MGIIHETWQWFLQPDHWTGDLGIWQRLGQHLYYVMVSLAIAILIAQPLGILLGYWRRGSFVVINLFNIGQAFPSLGIILLCIMLFGFTDVPVFIALVALAIPPMLTNTYVGISNADQTLCDAAKAMGMTPLQSLLKVRIPLAMPLIFAGIRTSLLQLIATAVVAAYAGLDGLGRFLIDGLGQRDIPQVVGGSLFISLMAIIFELLMAWIAKRWLRFSVPTAG